MRLALLHRRLAVMMSLAALTAFAVGAGMSPLLWAAALGMGVALVWHPGAEAGVWVERIGWVGAVLLFGWVMHVAVVARGDFLPPILAFLLFLLVTEGLRPLEVQNDLRLYALSFALLIAATAYFPGVTFGIAFVLFLALTTLALMVGHLRRQAERHQLPDIPLRRAYLGTTAALSGVTVLVSIVVFLSFPRLPHGWIGAARSGGASSMIGFGDGVSLGEHGGRLVGNPEIAFRVEFEGAPPVDVTGLHWRGRSYDHFDGVRWTRTRGMPPSAPPPGLYWQEWRNGPGRQYRVFGGPPGVRVLFGIHPVVDVIPHSPMRPALDPTGDVVYTGGDSPVYTVRSASAMPSEEALRSAAGGEPAAAGRYLQLPPLSPRVWALADSLMQGEPTRYDSVRAVERWLRSEFGYTLDLPATARETSVEHFLFERREGHCEYFSTAMVLLLRSAGIPARNVTGFLGGEWNPSAGYLAVTQNDAHSWVEAWFPGLGWVPFDPTPSGSRNLVAGSGMTPSWTWPLRFWVDGMQHRWSKWVLFYDLDKQLSAFRRVTALLSGERGADPVRGGGSGVPGWSPWLLGLGMVAGLGVWMRAGRRPRSALSAESRAYLAVRRAYQRAGYDLSAAATPLALLATLRAKGAPGVREAEEVVALYQRARFGGEEIGEVGRTRMRDGVQAVRRSVGRPGKRRPR